MWIATWQTSRSFDRDGKNSEIRPEISVLTLRLKRSSKVSSKVLKTIYWLPRYIFIYMLRNLDFKNIFLWLGFSHFFAMLYFFSFFFLPTRRTSSGSACTHHVAWNLHYARAHRILEGAPARHVACSLKFAGTFRLKRKKNNQRKYQKENQGVGF